jgi:hypothetical protein
MGGEISKFFEEDARMNAIYNMKEIIKAMEEQVSRVKEKPTVAQQMGMMRLLSNYKSWYGELVKKGKVDREIEEIHTEYSKLYNKWQRLSVPQSYTYPAPSEPN